MANLSITNTFSSGTVISSSQVNTNFSDIVTYINNRNGGSVAWDGLLVGANATVQSSTAGSNIRLRVQHSDNTSTSSNSVFLLDVGGTSGGDPYVNLSIPGTTNWSFGIDNSDSDKFKFVLAGDLSIASSMEITTANKVGINGAATSSRFVVHENTSDATLYTPLEMSYGGNAVSSFLRGQTTTGITSGGSYISSVTDALIIISGNDTTNFFRDIVAVSFNATPHVISGGANGSVSGAPAARTYTSDGTGVKLAMASGTYSVNVLALDLSRR